MHIANQGTHAGAHLIEIAFILFWKLKPCHLSNGNHCGLWVGGWQGVNGRGIYTCVCAHTHVRTPTPSQMVNICEGKTLGFLSHKCGIPK